MSRFLVRWSDSRSPWLILAGVASVIFFWPGLSSLASPPKGSSKPPATRHAPAARPSAPAARHAPAVRHAPSHSHNTPSVPRINIPRINIVTPQHTYPAPQRTYNPLPNTYVQPVQPHGNLAPAIPQILANPLPPTTIVATTTLKPNSLPPTGQQAGPRIMNTTGGGGAPPANVQLAARAITYEELTAAFGLIQGQQQEQLDQITNGLGPDMLADPAVAAAVQNIQNAIDNGEPITDADIDDLINAVTIANANGVPITGGLDPLTAIAALGGIQALGDLQQQLGQIPIDGGAIPLPAGLVDVILDPFLPADFVAILPSGAILDGTGGVGDFAMGEGTLAEAMGLPPGVGEPAPASTADPGDRTTSGLLIMNPAVNAVGIEYVINDQNYSTPSGYNQTLSGSGNWLAQFNRGPGFGDAKYNLTEGTYYFSATERGWELYRRDFSVTISNAENPGSFQYVVDNTNANVSGGQSQTHTGKFPMVIKFDRGGGNQPAEKQVSDPTVGKAQLRVAINTADNLWDLYPAKNFAAVSATAVVAAAAPSAAPAPGSVPAATTVMTLKPSATAAPTQAMVKFAPISPAARAKMKLAKKTEAPPRKDIVWKNVTKKPVKLPEAPVPEALEKP